MRPLQVYGWMDWRTECPPAPNGGRQTREVVAARSRREAARLAGVTERHIATYGSITGNMDEVATAMAEPGIVWWRPLDSRGASEWRRAPPLGGNGG